MENKVVKILTCLLLIFSAPAVCLDTSDHTVRRMETLVLDEAWTDDLGWTDAHHVAFQTIVLNSNGRKYSVPSGNDARDFLEAASGDYLCQRNDFGQTALHLAVRESNVEIVNLYIERRVPCLNVGNKDGDTALHYAAYWGRTECARLLLEGGADKEAKNHKGGTPLGDAREMARGEVVELLLSYNREEVSKNEF